MDTRWLSDMFVLSLPVAEKVLRPVIVYVCLIIGLRLAGKRELAQLNTFDLVVLLMLSNTVQNAIIGEDNSVTGGLLGAMVLLLVNALVVRFLYRHRALDHAIEGRATTLVARGKLIERNLERELITKEELIAAAHRQGFASLHDVDTVVLEPGGSLTFIGRRPQPEEERHRELLERIDALTREVAALKG